MKAGRNGAAFEAWVSRGQGRCTEAGLEPEPVSETCDLMLRFSPASNQALELPGKAPPPTSENGQGERTGLAEGPALGGGTPPISQAFHCCDTCQSHQKSPLSVIWSHPRGGWRQGKCIQEWEQEEGVERALLRFAVGDMRHAKTCKDLQLMGRRENAEHRKGQESSVRGERRERLKYFPETQVGVGVRLKASLLLWGQRGPSVCTQRQ